LAVGVTVTTAVTGLVPELVAVNEPIELPAPLAPSPILVLLLDHVKVAPAVVLLNVSVFWVALLQTDWLDGNITFGVGLTVIVNV
jgi:hypothetical protein